MHNLGLYKIGRAIFRTFVAHPDNVRLATQGPIIRDLLPDKIGLSLDIGCGTGRYTEWLSVRSKIVIGIDKNLNILKKLLSKSIKAGVVCASAEQLPFRSDTFNFALCTEVLEHLDNDGIAISEMNKILKSNGELVLSVPMLPPPYSDNLHKKQGYLDSEIKYLLHKYSFEVVHLGYCMLFISRYILRFVLTFRKLFGFPPPILPLVWIEQFMRREREKRSPFNLVVKAKKK